MDIVLQYVLSYVPTLIALLGEVTIIKIAVKAIKKSFESNEYKVMVEQNAALLKELREAKKLNKEYLTKIDRIKRGEE